MGLGRGGGRGALAGQDPPWDAVGVVPIAAGRRPGTNSERRSTNTDSSDASFLEAPFRSAIAESHSWSASAAQFQAPRAQAGSKVATSTIKEPVLFETER